MARCRHPAAPLPSRGATVPCAAAGALMMLLAEDRRGAFAGPTPPKNGGRSSMLGSRGFDPRALQPRLSLDDEFGGGGGSGPSAVSSSAMRRRPVSSSVLAGSLPVAAAFATLAAAATVKRVARAAAATKSVPVTTAAIEPVVALDRRKKSKMVDGREIPWNVWVVKVPFVAEVVNNYSHPRTITSRTPDSNWETCHMTIDHAGNFPCVEGQAVGVIAPGQDRDARAPAKLRLYSIASSSKGDDERSRNFSLCVKRVVEVNGTYANRQIGMDEPDASLSCYANDRIYRGICSNYLCDKRIGDKVLLTGPTGAEMLVPDDTEANVVMFATGTGIAPVRSCLRHLFHDRSGANPDGSRKFKGIVWLFLGVPYYNSLLYDDEHKVYQEKFPEQFRYSYAISKEQMNAKGQDMFIHTKVEENIEDVWTILTSPKAHIYISGLKGLESALTDVFQSYATQSGTEWSEVVASLRKGRRYHVEAY